MKTKRKKKLSPEVPLAFCVVYELHFHNFALICLRYMNARNQASYKTFLLYNQIPIFLDEASKGKNFFIARWSPLRALHYTDNDERIDRWLSLCLIYDFFQREIDNDIEVHRSTNVQPKKPRKLSKLQCRWLGWLMLAFYFVRMRSRENSPCQMFTNFPTNYLLL